MVNRFAPAQPMGLIRKAILIAVATLALMLLWATIAISQNTNPYYEMDPSGMMRPDGTIVQYGPPPPIQQGHPPVQGQAFTYKATRRSDGSYLITRNGTPWAAVAAKSGYFMLTDPNGTGSSMVLKLDQTVQHVQPDRSSHSTH